MVQFESGRRRRLARAVVLRIRFEAVVEKNVLVVFGISAGGLARISSQSKQRKRTEIPRKFEALDSKLIHQSAIRMSHSAQITILLLRAQQRNSRGIDGIGIIPQLNVQRLSLWPRNG